MQERPARDGPVRALTARPRPAARSPRHDGRPGAAVRRDEAARDAAAEALARLYDVDLLEDPGDLDLYLALAARTGGPILELGVGTGRIAVPLAAAGYRGDRRRP